VLLPDNANAPAANKNSHELLFLHGDAANYPRSQRERENEHNDSKKKSPPRKRLPIAPGEARRSGGVETREDGTYGWHQRGAWCAAVTLASAGWNTTRARFWSSETATRRTPGRADTAASTALVQAEHVMPVTRTCASAQSSPSSGAGGAPASSSYEPSSATPSMSSDAAPGRPPAATAESCRWAMCVQTEEGRVGGSQRGGNIFGGRRTGREGESWLLLIIPSDGRDGGLYLFMEKK
jgi:hypothetical protein